jgi:hypothetical protein
MRRIVAALLVLLSYAAAALAEELVVEVTNPRFKVTIPGLPNIKFEPHPGASQNPSAKIMGTTSDGISVSALTPTAQGASVQQCASWLAGSTLARATPDLSSVQFVPAGQNAWVLIYQFKMGQSEQLKAHVFSGNGKGQCLEVHISRMGAGEQQRQAWFSGFRGISVIAE